MKRVIIHIGQPKTGTSALQNVLSGSSEVLAGHGIGYYQTLFRYNSWKGASNADFLFYSALDRLGQDIGEEYREHLKEELPAFSSYCRKYGTILLSEEALWEGGVRRPALWKELRVQTEELCGAGTTVDVVLCLRRQDEWLLSFWKEMLRATRPETRDFPEFVAAFEKEGFTDYAARLADLEEVFGAEHLTVLGYAPGSSPDGGIIHDFFAALRLPLYPDLIYPNGHVNPSMTMAASQAMLMIDQGRVPCSSDCMTLYYASMVFSFLCPEKEEFYPLSKAARLELLQKCAEGNKQAARRYNAGEPFFDETLKDYAVWMPDEERDLSNALTIARTSLLSPGQLYDILLTAHRTPHAGGRGQT